MRSIYSVLFFSDHIDLFSCDYCTGDATTGYLLPYGLHPVLVSSGTTSSLCRHLSCHFLTLQRNFHVVFMRTSRLLQSQGSFLSFRAECKYRMFVTGSFSHFAHKSVINVSKRHFFLSVASFS